MSFTEKQLASFETLTSREEIIDEIVEAIDDGFARDLDGLKPELTRQARCALKLLLARFAETIVAEAKKGVR